MTLLCQFLLSAKIFKVISQVAQQLPQFVQFNLSFVQKPSIKQTKSIYHANLRYNLQIVQYNLVAILSLRIANLEIQHNSLIINALTLTKEFIDTETSSRLRLCVRHMRPKQNCSDCRKGHCETNCDRE